MASSGLMLLCCCCCCCLRFLPKTLVFAWFSRGFYRIKQKLWFAIFFARGTAFANSSNVAKKPMFYHVFLISTQPNENVLTPCRWRGTRVGMILVTDTIISTFTLMPIPTPFLILFRTPTFPPILTPAPFPTLLLLFSFLLIF